MHKLRRSQTTKSVLALAIAVITTGVQTGLAAIPPMMGELTTRPSQPHVVAMPVAVAAVFGNF